METRASLLSRLRQSPDDQTAWEEFVQRYGPRIHSWCRRWNLQEADAEDVTQAVLIQLAVKLRSFVYDPSRSFRGWLKLLTRHALCDCLAERKRASPGGVDHLDELEAREDLERRLAEAFDLEIFEVAKERVRCRVAPKTWDAFRLTALDGVSGAEAAARLGMQVAAVFVAKSNVKKMIREEIDRLDEAGP